MIVESAVPEEFPTGWEVIIHAYVGIVTALPSDLPRTRSSGALAQWVAVEYF
jgi:hypothetical protein